MTKDRLVALYNKFKENNIAPEKILVLKLITNEQIDLILNSKYPEAIITLLVNLNYHLQSEEIRQQLVNIINNSKGIEQARYASTIAIDEKTIASGNLLEYVTFASNAIGKFQALNVSRIATSDITIERSNLLEIMKLTSEAKNEVIAEFLSAFAMYKFIVEDEQLLKEIKDACELESNETILIFKDIVNRIDKKININRNKEYNIWELFEKAPQEAIKLLEEMPGNDEIMPYTRVKRGTDKH